MLSPLSFPRTPCAVRCFLAAAAAALSLGVAGCSTAQPSDSTAQPPNSTAQRPNSTAQHPEAASGPSHVHGAYADPQTGRLLLASHNGLFEATGEHPVKIGPTIDLMGFAADEDGTFYASGHPGPGVGLPNPVGLITSTDGGATWRPVSRQGESDFHALAVTGDGFVGFDGELRISRDGREWDSVRPAPEPHALAGGPGHGVVLATTGEGVWRSEDGGSTWSAPSGGPVLLTAAFIDARTAAGVSPDGTVYVSEDAGKKWKSVGRVQGQPAAVTGTRTGTGLALWVAGTEGGTERLDVP
ncbi:hypothetical protein NCCP1664_21790 [Zafaria cholistanensis]|uniref:Exo-alpha-sialidase n=1 Tax=Zafaria cholistanensis TaxID=1682741 RepID=A0A5A7NS16_9MICC|nr:sialidase family protein [Zafaria cholistanensis]GER23684.1 hypothetical protein NCCP1664_21790 [Zafaria cholistanensis]